MRNYGPAVLYLLFKSINPDTRIGVSNLTDEIHKSTLAEFINNVKNFIDDISSNYSIIIDKVEFHEVFFRCIFRSIFSGPKSTFNFLI